MNSVLYLNSNMCLLKNCEECPKKELVDSLITQPLRQSLYVSVTRWIIELKIV